MKITTWADRVRCRQDINIFVCCYIIDDHRKCSIDTLILHCFAYSLLNT